MKENRRDFLKFLAGVGLGAVGAEIYERLYNIPLLERSFRREVEHWITQYNSANEELRRSQETLIYQDELERESTLAISPYQERMNEAIEGLRKAIERYRVILGEERVAFESSSLKVLEDLKITKEKLLKVLPYFPLIKDLSWSPSEVVNDKIYSLNVSLQVISPLNTLEELRVSLIPAEYPYPKEAFPDEEVKIIEFQPKGLEREIFSGDFLELKGGREYLIEAVPKDVAGNVNSEEIKTPYIREFENIASKNIANISVTMVPYKELFKGEWWHPTWHTPLLGKYSLSDPIVISKQIDHATGHGVNFFLIDTQWGETYDEISRMVSNPLFSEEGVSFAILYNSINSKSLEKTDGWKIDFNNKENVDGLKNDFQILATRFFTQNNYLKVERRPLVYLYYSHSYVGGVSNAINPLRTFLKDNFNSSVYLFSDVVERYHPLHPLHTSDRNELSKLVYPYDGITFWGGGFSGQPIYIGDTYEEQLEALCSISSEIARTNGKGLMVSFKNGENTSLLPWGSKIILPRSPELFKERLEILLRHIKDYPYFNSLRIDTWDEWYEDNEFAPSKEEGFIYPQILKDRTCSKYS